MDVENTFIKPLLLFYFGKGKTEIETYFEVTQNYGQLTISQRTIDKWFKKFKVKEKASNNKNYSNSKDKLSDEKLINLVNDNSELSTKELTELTGTPIRVIEWRLKCINSGFSRSVNNINKELKRYIPKLSIASKKFNDDYLIDLINNNPELNIKELATIANCSKSTISIRLNQINQGGGEQVVNYISKKYKSGGRKFTDESLINLINNNSSSSLKELANLLDVCPETISKRLKQINNNRADDDKIVLSNKDKFGRTRMVHITDERLIDLINNNPSLNMKELGRLSNTTSQYISRRLGQINKEGKRVNYINKYSKKSKSEFTDDFIINLINQNPHFSTYELAKLANCSRTTIITRLNKINKVEQKVVYNSKKGQQKFSDSYLIELINNNPGLSVKELGEISGAVRTTIVRRLKQINKGREADNKSILEICSDKSTKKLNFTDEFLIDLINENPELNMKELGTICNCSDITISRRIKKINSVEKRVNYTNKNKLRYMPKFSDEYLIELINNNPELSMRELGNLAGCSKSTILKRLRNVNKDGERVNYIMKRVVK